MCSFPDVCRVTGTTDVAAYFDVQGPLPLQLVDIRQEEWESSEFTLVGRKALEGDPEGYREVAPGFQNHRAEETRFLGTLINKHPARAYQTVVSQGIGDLDFNDISTGVQGPADIEAVGAPGPGADTDSVDRHLCRCSDSPEIEFPVDGFVGLRHVHL